MSELRHLVARLVCRLKLIRSQTKVGYRPLVLFAGFLELRLIACCRVSAVHIHNPKVGYSILNVGRGLVDKIYAVVKGSVGIGVEVLLKELPIGALDLFKSIFCRVLVNKGYVGEELLFSCRTRRYRAKRKQRGNYEYYRNYSLHKVILSFNPSFSSLCF